MSFPEVCGFDLDLVHAIEVRKVGSSWTRKSSAILRRRGRPEHESTSPLSAETVSSEAPERALPHTGDAELVALVAEASRTHGNQLPYLPAFDPPCDSPPGISSAADLAERKKMYPAKCRRCARRQVL